MAPNLVKSASLCSLDMSHMRLSSNNLLALDQPSYPPLTDAALTIDAPNDHEENSVFGLKTRTSTMRRTPSMLFRIIVEEEAQKAVSCAHIETNLVADANKAKIETTKEYVVNENQQEEESYWDMPSESDCAVVDTVDVFSAGQVERLLVEDALRRCKEVEEQKAMVQNNHPNNSYWNWSSEPVLESEKKSNLIASIMMEESIRQKLSIDHITNTEVSNKSQTDAPSQIESVSTSTDYWCWNAEEEVKEVVAPHVNDPSHPNNAYWDFPHESRDPQDMKKKLIDTILNEERIRNILSMESVESREINFHRMKKQAKDDTDNYAPASVLNSVPSNYWDFNPAPEGLLSLVATEKQELIDRILKEEKQRYIVSTENIEKNLVSRDSCEEKSNQEPSLPVSSYWDW